MEELATLVNQAQKGDADAFSEIVRRFQDMAVGYSHSLLGNPHLAEDAAQEAFLEAFLNLGQIREPAAFPGWFRRVVFKQCDRLRRGRGKRFEPLQNESEEFSQQPDQVKAMEERETKDQVWMAVRSLPEHERAAVILYYLSGYSQEEVANFLDVTVTAVKKRLFSARKRLREMLMDLVADTLRQRRPSRNNEFASAVIDMLQAARTGDVQRVALLLQRNRSLIAKRDWLGNTPLIMAVNSGQHAVAELLYQAGVQPDIHEAAAIGDVDRVKTLLRADGTQIHAYSQEGFTPIALAAHYGHSRATRFLIDHGADVNAVSRHPLEVTPLHAALFGRRIETARMLIQAGADVNARRGGLSMPRSGWTALHYAASFGLVDLIPLLLKRGADANVTDNEGRTPARVAAEANQAEALAILNR